MRETPSFNSRSFEYGRSPEGSAAMLPTFLNDLRRSTAGNGGAGETVELTLDIEDDSLVLCAAAPPPVLSRSSSAATKLRRIFSWRRSTSERENQSTVESVREMMKLKTKMMRNQSSARRALGGLRFISKTTIGESSDPEVLWKKVEARFDTLAKDGMLSRIDFGECIGMGDSKEFAVGVFDALVRRRRRRAVVGITKAELREFWLQISDQSFDARLQIFFDMADSNGDGKIARDEVQELIILSASANKLSNLKERAKEYASLIMEELDPECLGYIELWQLETLLLQRDNYMNYSRPLSTTTSAGWSQNLSRVTAKHMVNKIGLNLKCLVSENWQRGWILLLWLSIMAGLFTWKYQQYRQKAAFRIMGHCVTTAKGAAETLKFNMALILLPVCRNMLTWLRSSRARLIIPFDDNINFHKMVAYAIGIGVVIHAGVHLTCDFPRLVRSSPDKFALIASDFHGEKPTYSRLLESYIGVTGILMVALMMIVFTLATSKFRKNGGKLPPPFNRLTGFNAFWYSHHLTAIIYILFLIHGATLFLVHKWYQKTTWMYISIPLLLYVADRTLRTHRPKDCAVKILKVNVLPGGVFSLILAKPNGFKYKSGQYIFLQCPTISPFEWHPFSLTSAPGDDYLSVHIRAIGDWTQELKRVFTEDNCSASVIGHAKFGTLEGVNHTGVPKLLVDGPYGAPAQEYKNYDVLLLVGLGIGATPFISILKDLLNNTKLDDHSDSNTDATTSDDSLNSMTSPSDASSAKKRVQRARTAHFYWITRESGSFEWFKGVMNEVAEMDLKGQIELHNYLTSVYEESDARSTLITMVQALNHAKHGVDILSGTRVRTHFARPNWRHVFNKVASKHPCSTVGVFYCGMPVLAKELKQLSQELTQKTSTRFEFHKEYF